MFSRDLKSSAESAHFQRALLTLRGRWVYAVGSPPLAGLKSGVDIETSLVGLGPTLRTQKSSLSTSWPASTKFSNTQAFQRLGR